MTEKIRDVLFDQPDIKLVADFKNESSKAKYPEVDGVFVLGVMEGEFFVPDGKSVNERFYPRTFWESVLKQAEVQTVCANYATSRVKELVFLDFTLL